MAIHHRVVYKLIYFVLQSIIGSLSSDGVLRYKLNYFVPGRMISPYTKKRFLPSIPSIFEVTSYNSSVYR